MRRSGSTVLLLATISALLLTAACEKRTTAERTRIGALLPLSGDVAVFGQWIREGIELAKELDSPEAARSYEMIYIDTQDDPKLGLSAARRLLEADKVDALISAMSRVSIPLISVATEARVPLLLQDVTFPGVTNRSMFVFRHFIQSDREARILAEYALAAAANEQDRQKQARKRRFAILTVNDEAGIAAMNSFKASCAGYGQIVASESFGPRETEFRTISTKLLAENPGVIFLFGNGPSWAGALRAVRDLGFAGDILTNAAMYIPPFRKLAGDRAEGTIFTYPKMDESQPSARRFAQTYRDKHKMEPPIEAAYAYDLALIVRAACAQSGGNFYHRLLAVKLIDGAFGRVTIGPNRDIETPIVIGVIEKGAIRELARR